MKNRKFIFQLAILSISLFITSYLSASPVLPLISRYFNSYEKSSMESLITMPALSMTIMVFMSSFLLEKIDIKKMTIMGLTLTACAGMVPFFYQKFIMILISRFLLGIGLGILNFCAVEVINQNYSGNEKAKMLGIRSAVECLGQSLLTMIAGNLVVFGWEKVFGIYVLVIPIAFLFYKVYPDNHRKEKIETATSKQKINYSIMAISLFTFLLIGTHTSLIVRLSEIIVSKKIGNIEDASKIQSLATLAGMMSGCCFGYLYAIISKYILPIGLGILSAAHYLVYYGSNLRFVFLGAFLEGITFSILLSYMFQTMGEVCEKGTESLSNSVILAGCNLGGFLSPYLLKGVSSVFGVAKNIVFPFRIFSYFFLLMFLIEFYFLRFKKNFN